MSRLTYERAKQLYAPYDADQMRHLCALRDIEIERLRDENAKLREQMEQLVTLLRNDCDIDASWDGLRRFWSIWLTENGCLMRDRACKAEAENAKLRELVRGLKYCAHEAHGMCARVLVGGERPFTCCPLYDFDAKKYRCEEFMLELGIEVGE